MHIFPLHALHVLHGKIDFKAEMKKRIKLKIFPGFTELEKFFQL